MSGKDTGAVLLALLTGAVIGAVAGIAYAPDKGSKTRKKMRKHVREAKHDLSVRAKRASRELNRSAKERKAVFEHQLEEAISDLSVKADDLIATLEHKLAELKAKNANLQKGHPPAGSK